MAHTWAGLKELSDDELIAEHGPRPGFHGADDGEIWWPFPHMVRFARHWSTARDAGTASKTYMSCNALAVAPYCLMQLGHHGLNTLVLAEVVLAGSAVAVLAGGQQSRRYGLWAYPSRLMSDRRYSQSNGKTFTMLNQKSRSRGLDLRMASGGLHWLLCASCIQARDRLRTLMLCQN